MNSIDEQPNITRPSEINRDFHFLAYPAHLLMWSSDHQGLCTFVSPSWLTFTGRVRTAELGKGWLDRVHPDDCPLLERELNLAITNRQPFRLMFRYLRKDGIYRWLVTQGHVHTTLQDEFLGHQSHCFDITQYQDSEAEFDRSLQDIFPLLKKTRLIAVVLDTEGRVQFSNGALGHLLKLSGSQLFNSQLFKQHLAPDDADLLAQLYHGGNQSNHFPTEFQSQLLTNDKETRYISWHSIIWRDYSGQLKGTLLIGDDITKLREEEAQISIYAKAIEATDHAIVVTDATGVIISVNSAFIHLTGYSREEALGNNPRILQSGHHTEAFYRQFWETLTNTGHWHGDIWDRRKDGHVYPKYMSVSAIKNSNGELTNFMGIFYDNSERVNIEERLERLAHYDSLTGLPNRSLLIDRLEQSMERALRQKNKAALLFLDLDGFKAINDQHGHLTGDQILKAAAERMKSCVRSVDTVSRLGGDEFVILIPDVNEPDTIATVAKKILSALAPPHTFSSYSVNCSASIGVSLFPEDGQTVNELLERADLAMYRAKRNGRGNYEFYHQIDSTVDPKK